MLLNPNHTDQSGVYITATQQQRMWLKVNVTLLLVVVETSSGKNAPTNVEVIFFFNFLKKNRLQDLIHLR